MGEEVKPGNLNNMTMLEVGLNITIDRAVDLARPTKITSIKLHLPNVGNSGYDIMDLHENGIDKAG